jgi:hypothetical protein
MNRDFKAITTIVEPDFKQIVLIDHENWVEQSAPEDIPVRFLPLPVRRPANGILNGIRYSPSKD